jgi:hypothetical protein
MRIPWVSGRSCRQVRDLILSRAIEPGAPPLPPGAARHARDCRGCREFEEAFIMVDRMGPAWRAPEAPPGLAQRTIDFMEPHWRRAHRPVSRQEIRLIWSSGLAVAGAAAAFALVLADQAFPLGQGTQLGAVLRVGLRVGVLWLAGNVLISLVLAVRARRARGRSSRLHPGVLPGETKS